MPQGVTLGNRPSGRRHLLVMNPDPKKFAAFCFSYAYLTGIFFGMYEAANFWQ